MSYDPQIEPEFRATVIKRLIDIDGVEIILWRDEDGQEWVSTADEFDNGPDVDREDVL